jgi:hypothetical protein
MLALALGKFDGKEFVGLQMRKLLAEVAGEAKPTTSMYGAFKSLMAEGSFSVVKQEPLTEGSSKLEYTVMLSEEGKKRARELVTDSEEGTEFTVLVSHRPDSTKGSKNDAAIPDELKTLIAKRHEYDALEKKRAELQKLIDDIDERRDVLRDEINEEAAKLKV